MVYKRGKHWHMDVMVNGVRYREGLKTTDRREALSLEKLRITEITQGKGASKTGREFARQTFVEATVVFQAERKAHVSERTSQFESERLKPLIAYFGEKLVMRIRPGEIAAYQTHRLKQGLSNRTVNMELSVLRRILKRGKVWNAIAEDVKPLPENQKPIGKVLTAEQKQRLFETAASNEAWMVAYCAAVLAVSTTCRGIEIKNAKWADVDLPNRVISIGRSKTQAGHRSIPLNDDAAAALERLWDRAEAVGSSAPDHYVFPACEHAIDPTRPQKSFRTSWRKLTIAAGLPGFRFHDLRHQAITELAEAGASDAALMAIAGHMSRRMMEHYSHVRMAIKRDALDKLSSGLMKRKATRGDDEKK